MVPNQAATRGLPGSAIGSTQRSGRSAETACHWGVRLRLRAGSRSAGCKDRRPRSSSVNPTLPAPGPSGGRPARPPGSVRARTVGRTGVPAGRAWRGTGGRRRAPAGRSRSRRAPASRKVRSWNRGSRIHPSSARSAKAGEEADARHEVLHDPCGRTVRHPAVGIAPQRRDHQGDRRSVPGKSAAAFFAAAARAQRHRRGTIQGQAARPVLPPHG